MANILIGDVHGCYDPFRRLLDNVAFDPTADVLWLTGDLIARGPKSLEVLRFVKKLEKNHLRLCLGNHDLHLMAIHNQICNAKPKDNLTELLNAPDIHELIDWLRKQPVLQVDHQLKLLMVHSGVSPQWDLSETERCAHELEKTLSGKNYTDFLQTMYGDEPDYWTSNLTGMARLRYISNAFTRMRYCYQDGRLNLTCKVSPNEAPPQLKPWFLLKNRLPKDYTIAFGHWASLKEKGVPKPFYALDTGCCWGGKLTALRFEDKRLLKQDCANQNISQKRNKTESKYKN